MFDEISFPSHEGLPWESSPPLPDGYTEPHPGLPLSAWRLEAGYVHGGKFTYEGSGGAHPAAVFQGVKQAWSPYLHLAFDIRFDPTFNDSDRVMLIIRRAFSPQVAGPDDRRIDVRPVTAGGGGAAAAPVDPHDLPAYGYRTNKAPQALEVYKRSAAGPDVWQGIAVQRFECKVSSSEPTAGAKNWTVELKIPTTKDGEDGGGGDWIDLTDDFGLYVNLIRLTNAAGASGPKIGGFFSTQFTWPYDPANPTANLLTDAGMGGVKPPENWDVAPAKLGRAHILAPGAANPARGVKFKDGYLGIGVLQPNGTIGGTVDLRKPRPGQPEPVNHMVARLINDHLTDAANGVQATFRIADFGLGPYGYNAAWDPVNSTPNPAPTPPPGTIPTGGLTSVDLVSDWTAGEADRIKYGGIWDDQCVWVELDTSAAAYFAESSVRRNLTIQVASEVKTEAVISGRLPTPPAGPGGHDYWLHTMKLRLEGRRERPPDLTSGLTILHAAASPPDGSPPEGSPPQESPPDDPQQVFDELNASPLLTGEMVMTDKPAVTWLWVAVGYWRTGETLTVDGKEHAVWINSGNFATVVHHELAAGQGPDDVDLKVDLSGPGVTEAGPGLSFKVPKDGVKKLPTRIRAGTPKELEEGAESWWMRLLRLIIELLRRLFRRS